MKTRMKAQTLFIQPDTRARQFHWLLIDQGERQPLAAGDEAALAADLLDLSASQPQVVLVLPAEAALHTVVEVPRRQRRFLSRSLPFILEAQTAQDIEELHIVPGEALPGEQLEVFAVPHALVRRLLQLVSAAGLQASALVLDTQLLAGSQSRSIQVVWQDDRMLISLPGRGMACTRQNLSAWLDRLVPEGHADWPLRLHVSAELGAEAETLVAELEQSWSHLEPVQTVTAGWLPMLADFWLQNRRVRNLLTGPYEQADAFSRWKPIIPGVAASAGLLLVAGALYFVADLRQTEARAQATWAAAEAVFSEAVDGQVSFNRQRIRQQVDDLLARRNSSGRSDGTFLPLLVRVDQAMNGDALSLEELRFTSDRAELQMQVRGASTEILEALRSELEAQDLSVTYSASRVEEGFRGNFRVQYLSGGAS